MEKVEDAPDVFKYGSTFLISLKLFYLYLNNFNPHETTQRKNYTDTIREIVSKHVSFSFDIGSTWKKVEEQTTIPVGLNLQLDSHHDKNLYPSLTSKFKGDKVVIDNYETIEIDSCQPGIKTRIGIIPNKHMLVRGLMFKHSENNLIDPKKDTNLKILIKNNNITYAICLLYTSPSPRDATLSRMPSSA